MKKILKNLAYFMVILLTCTMLNSILLSIVLDTYDSYQIFFLVGAIFGPTIFLLAPYFFAFEHILSSPTLMFVVIFANAFGWLGSLDMLHPLENSTQDSILAFISFFYIFIWLPMSFWWLHNHDFNKKERE